MTKLIYATNVTLDGYIEDERSPGASLHDARSAYGRSAGAYLEHPAVSPSMMRTMTHVPAPERCFQP